MNPEDLAEAATDCLINADLWVGGAIGVRDPDHEEEIIAWLTGRGYIGPNWGLTRKGLAEAKRAYKAYWED